MTITINNQKQNVNSTKTYFVLIIWWLSSQEKCSNSYFWRGIVETIKLCLNLLDNSLKELSKCMWHCSREWILIFTPKLQVMESKCTQCCCIKLKCFCIPTLSQQMGSVRYQNSYQKINDRKCSGWYEARDPCTLLVQK